MDYPNYIYIYQLFFSILQSGFLLFYLKQYIYNTDLTNLGSMILESSFYEDIDKENPTIVFLKSKGINQMDIDKLVKFNLFYKEYEERYNKIYKRKLKNLLEGKQKKKKKAKKPKKPKKIKKPKKSKKNK